MCKIFLLDVDIELNTPKKPYGLVGDEITYLGPFAGSSILEGWDFIFSMCKHTSVWCYYTLLAAIAHVIIKATTHVDNLSYIYMYMYGIYSIW